MAASKRKAGARVGLEVLVTVIPEGGRPHLGKSRNLSTTGMLVEIAGPLEVGSRAQLKLFLPGIGKLRLSATGQVIREAEPIGEVRQYGLRFVEMPAETAIAIERFLTARSSHEDS